jgi:release factor glutamine methyltransferase
MPTAGQLLRDAVGVFKKAEAIEHPNGGKDQVDAEDLLSFVLGREADPDDEVEAAGARRFRRLVSRRAAGEPPAYLTGRTLFLDLELEVRRGAFIPRESSEFLAEQAARRLRGRRSPVALDLGTGIGPVALAVAAAVPAARVYGVDVSARPVELARRNARRLGLRNVTFLRGDLFAPLPPSLRGRVDVITSHPPYVGIRELKTLPTEILHFEPKESLTDGSPDGSRLLGSIVSQAPGWLRRGGWLMIEVSPDRARGVATVLRRAGFHDVRSTKGIVTVSRVVLGRRS